MSISKPLIVHVHVPKTAGTSLNTLLGLWFGPRHSNLYHPQPNHWYSEAELNEYVAARPEMISLSSHSIRLFPPLIADRPVFYYCFLREPLDLLVSTFTYLKKNYHNLSPEHRARLPLETPTMDLRDLISYRLGRDQGERFPGNWLNRFFAEPSFVAKRQWLGTAKPDSAEEAAEFARVCLPISMTSLDRFLFVGLTERFEEGVNQLRDRLGAMGISTGGQPVPKENISKELRSDESWIRSGEGLGPRIQEALRLDIPLYRYGAGLFSGQ
jgi:hypothetical protein